MTDGWAETYLRLRAEAELRRALTLPRFDLAEPDDRPEPVRIAAELLRPVGAEAARVLQPVADEAARRLRPVADEAARRLRPARAEAARVLQPVAAEAERRLASLAAEAERRLRPAADEVTQKLQSLIWEATETLRTMRTEARDRLPRWPSPITGPASVLRRLGPQPTPWPGQRGLSAEGGVRRLRGVAEALVLAGSIDRPAADSILDSLETALLARARISQREIAIRDLSRRRRQPQAAAPAGPYRAVPIGLTLPPDPAAGNTGEISLLTLVITPAQMVLTAAGQLRPGMPGPPMERWLMQPGPGGPAATDERGNRYQLSVSGWTSGDHDWYGTLEISPQPPAGIGWLELTIGPGSAPVKVNLAGESRPRSSSGPTASTSPVAALLDAVAERMLFLAADSPAAAREYSLTEVADMVTALAATGALPVAQAAVDRMVTLAGKLGVTVPAALAEAARPAELPEMWTSVLQHRRIRDGPRAAAPAAAVLPELDGIRFVLAGLQSDTSGAELTVLAWGPRPWPDPFSGEGTRRRYSWRARDDAGRWHVLSAGGGGELHSEIRLRLRPPLHPRATALQVIAAGPSGQVSATVPLNWLKSASATGKG